MVIEWWADGIPPLDKVQISLNKPEVSSAQSYISPGSSVGFCAFVSKEIHQQAFRSGTLHHLIPYPSITDYILYLESQNLFLSFFEYGFSNPYYIGPGFSLKLELKFEKSEYDAVP